LKLDLFFKGMQNKETTASAWLATLLREDKAFRSAFFNGLQLDPPLDAEDPWEARIETPLGSGFCDVTLESATTYILIENKMSSAAVTPGQFLAYYRGAIADPTREPKRIIGVYVGPSGDTGSGEVATVAASARPDGWFAQAGLEAILAHIAKLRVGRPFAQQRQELLALLRRVAERTAREGASRGWGGDVRFEHWGSRGQEALYTPRQAVTTWLILSYPETEHYEIGEIFVDGTVNVRASVSFNPSTKIGLRDAALMARWTPMIDRRSVAVRGLGEVPARDDVTFELAVSFANSSAELEDLLVVWGTSVLDFLEPFR